MPLFFPFAERHGLVFLVPYAAGRTWDVVLGGFGPDVEMIGRALEHTFDHCAIDPARVVIGGFSDGGSYALSLGLTNGDLFSRVVAFSPGFMVPKRRVGTPKVFLSHGTHDEVLPINGTSRPISRQLTEWGYGLTYREFEGPHTVPAAIATEAFTWAAA